MSLASRPLAAALFAVVLALPAAAPARAQTFSADQRGEIEKIIKEYLLTHPELMQDVMNELEKKQATAEAEKHRATVKENSAAIFASPRQVTLGNPQGDVTVVEFFDYNCSYCKRAMRRGSIPAAGLASTSVTSLAASGWNAPSSTSTLACGLCCLARSISI